MESSDKLVPLGDLAMFEMGQSPDSTSVAEAEIGIPFLQGSAEFGATTPQHRLYCTQPKKLCRAGDILISVRAPVGDLNKADQTYCIGRGLAAIRFHKALPEFGWHLLSYWAGNLRTVAQGTTFEAISRIDLQNLPVAYVPEPEQRRIAAILDTADAAIQQTEALIAKLKQAKAGLLHDLLTRGLDEHGQLRDPVTHPEQFKDSPLGRVPREWDASTIGTVAVHVASGSTPRGGSEVYHTKGILFLRSQNVTFDGLLLDDVAYITPQIHASMKRSEVFPHDVLLNITGASIGRCCPLPEGLGTANVNQHVCAIRLPTPSREDAVYLSAVLASHIGQSQIDQLNAGGNREGLNYQQLRAFVIPWPKPKERARIATVIHAHDTRIRIEEAYRDKLKLQKQGLMHDLLTGRVGVDGTERVMA